MGCTSSVGVDDHQREALDGVLREAKPGDLKSSYSFGSQLGKGGFAEVYAIRERATGKQCAVKIVGGRRGKEKDAGDEKSRREHVEKEIAAWTAVRQHGHVVEFMSAVVEQNTCFMIMERCECDLLRKISVEPSIWRSDSARVLKEMLLGVQACHDVDIVHRDIKPANFLVGADGVTIKLCDFGLAVRMPKSGYLSGRTGTAPFMSPEMLKGSKYGKATDVWSYGVSAYLLCYGELPFMSDSTSSGDVQEAILKSPPPRRLQGAGLMACFLRTVLERCPSLRSQVVHALGHQFFRNTSTDVRRHMPSVVPIGASKAFAMEAALGSTSAGTAMVATSTLSSGR